jgi:uncharacterized protein (TIGR03086 family)
MGTSPVMIDLEPAARRVAELIRNVRPDQLDWPTPCPAYNLGALIDHVGGLSLAFTDAAEKDPAGASAQGGSGDAARLGDDWQSRIPGELEVLAAAWKDPAAWDGMTAAGGIEMPGEVAGMVALDEVVIHGWDIAQSLDEPYECDAATLEAVHDFVASFSPPDARSEEDGLFGPAVPVPDDAPLLDRIVGMTGRDPHWSAP